jgi:hypothetical protein
MLNSLFRETSATSTEMIRLRAQVVLTPPHRVRADVKPDSTDLSIPERTANLRAPSTWSAPWQTPWLLPWTL